MDAQQRADVGRQVAAARNTRGWTQKQLAAESGVAPNTVGAIEAGKNVQAGKLASVMDALGIEPLAEKMEREGLPADVHLVTEVVSLWLASTPEEDRPQAVFDLFRFLGHR